MIFSKQFCGQQSYGHQDYLDYLEQMPPHLKRNSNLTLAKPQIEFKDIICNSEPMTPIKSDLSPQQQAAIIDQIQSTLVNSDLNPHSVIRIEDNFH